MTKEQIFAFLSSNLGFNLATVENGEPRVRGMMLYKADETGITFHTGVFKDVYRQIIANPSVQMCFRNPEGNTQIRVRGVLEEVTDIGFKDEIAEHPTRGFVKAWKEGGMYEDFYRDFKVFRLKNGIANVWTYDTNFAPKEDIQL